MPALDAENAQVIARLGQILIDRRDSSPGGGVSATNSYTKSLLEKGMPKILEKIAEESGELAAELGLAEGLGIFSLVVALLLLFAV